MAMTFKSCLLAGLVAIIAAGVAAQNPTPVLDPPTPADFGAACALFNTSFTCARAVGAICLWDMGTNTCQFRSKACPADLKAAMIAISECGASMNNTCPPACTQPQLKFVALLHVHAGLHTFVSQKDLMDKATSNTTIAQAIADVQYCTTELTPMQYTNMLLEGCHPSNDQYNAAIAAEFGGTTPSPASSSHSSSPASSPSSGSMSSSATASAAVLAINTVVNGLALGLIIMYAAGM